MWKNGSILLLLGALIAACAHVPKDINSPRILIFGTAHLNQLESYPSASELKKISQALINYRPDMVVVEYLPADWPVGEGRDYRTAFDMDKLSRQWNTPSAIEERDKLATDFPLNPKQRLALGKQYFLERNFVNAAYQWYLAGATPPLSEAAQELTQWLEKHELGAIGFPIAKANQISGLVSFDYQGADAEWFLHSLLDEIREKGTPAEKSELDQYEQAAEKLFGEVNQHIGGVIEAARFFNSGRFLDIQREVYEEAIPTIRYLEAGARQTKNYWLRNQRMFTYIDQAAREQAPQRILVIVGAGHKYFLDEIAKRNGYHWVDPLQYLPSLKE